MRVNKQTLGVLGGMALLAATNASYATAILTDQTLSVGDPHYLGLWDLNGSTVAANLGAEADRINRLNDVSKGDIVDPGSDDEGIFYDRTDSTLGGEPPDFPDIMDTSSGNALKADGKTATNNSHTVENAYQYVLGKYDGRNAGSMVWFHEEGFTGTLTLPGTWIGSSELALSHMSFFNRTTSETVPVPATLLLLGVGLAGLAFGVRRR